MIALDPRAQKALALAATAATWTRVSCRCCSDHPQSQYRMGRLS